MILSLLAQLIGRDDLGSRDSYDSDAEAFITATGITDNTQKDAINNLVLDLKSASLWTKLSAIYPFVGGTASTHKWNLKDPRDLDVAHRLEFSGGWTHSATGAFGNGSDAYAETNLIASSVLSQNSGHLSVYSRNNDTTNQSGEFSLPDGTTQTRLILFGSTFYFAYASPAGGGGDQFIANNSGFLVANRVSSTTTNCWRNGSKLNTLTESSTAFGVGVSFLLGKWLSYHTHHEYGFASIGAGLSDSEAGDLYTIVQAYQTALGRNV